MSLQSYKKVYESLEGFIESLGAFDKTPYGQLGDEERRLFDKLAENDFGKQENIIEDIKSIGGKALYLFGGLFVALEFFSETGLIEVGTFVGSLADFLTPIALYLLIFSLCCLIIASLYKGILLWKKNKVLKDYKTVENTVDNTINPDIESTVSEKLSQSNDGIYAEKPGLLITFQSIQELRDSVLKLRSRYVSLKEKMRAQAFYSNPVYSHPNIRNQCTLYINNALGLLSENSLGVVIDGIIKPRVDLKHRQYSNFFSRMPSYAAQGENSIDEDDQFAYLNDCQSAEFQERSKDLLSSAINGFAGDQFLLLESQYRMEIVRLEEAVDLLERVNNCLGDPEHADLSQYESAMQEEAIKISLGLFEGSLSVDSISEPHDFKGGGAIEDECAEHTVADQQPARYPRPELKILIKRPIVDAVSVMARVARESHEEPCLFVNCRALINRGK